MTRRQFINDITTWPELLSFCSAYALTTCEDIITLASLAGHIADDMVNYGREYNWQDICDWLGQIRTGYPYYRKDSCFEYEALDDSDFQDYKDAVIAECDDDDLWDPDYTDGSPFDDDILDDFFITEDDPDDEEPDLEDGDSTDDDLLELLEKKFY